MTIQQVDPHDDKVLRAWYDATRVGAEVGRTAPPVFGYESLGVSLRDPNPSNKRVLAALYRGDDVVAALMLELPQAENRQVVEWTLNVPPSERNRGYGTEIFEYGLRLAAEHGRTVHQTEVDVPADMTLDDNPGSRFALAKGFTSQHSEDRLLLDVPVAESKLTELMEYASARHRDYEFVSWTRSCPSAYLEAYAEMRTTMEQDVPTGGLDREARVWDVDRVRVSDARMLAQGYVAIVTAARDRDGQFAGYSRLFVPTHTPPDVLQDDTLVISDHRGHRLGAAMKVRNLRILQRDFPERSLVHTWTAGTNAEMRHVNAAFGFRAVEQMHEFERIDAAGSAMSTVTVPTS